jgi:hypothetical protein
MDLVISNPILSMENLSSKPFQECLRKFVLIYIWFVLSPHIFMLKTYIFTGHIDNMYSHID